MQISRRDALLATGAAAITVTATVAPLAAKAALGGDPAVAVSQQLRAADKAWDDACNVYEEAAHRVDFSICYGAGLVEVESSDGPCHWGAREIRAAAEDGRHHHRLTIEERDAALAKLDWLRNDAQKRRRELGIESLWQTREHWESQYWELRELLIDTPATTPAGVLAKMDGFYHDGETANMRDGGCPDSDLPRDYAGSIYCDLERLSSEARS